MTVDRPDESSTDEELWALLLEEIARVASLVETQAGMVRVELPDEESDDDRRVEIRMTSRQLRESVTSLSADGREALGIADPVAAGWALFTVHLEEHLQTLRPEEDYLVWHDGALQPSTHLEWPPTRGTLPRFPLPSPGDRLEWRAYPRSD